jgi:hypothetical protein
MITGRIQENLLQRESSPKDKVLPRTGTGRQLKVDRSEGSNKTTRICKAQNNEVPYK